MLPVKGARSEFDCTGSSKSLIFATGRNVSKSSYPIYNKVYRHQDL